MFIGTCVGLSLLGEKLPGYKEIPARALYAMEHRAFQTLKAQVDAGAASLYAANCLTPNDMRLTGSDVHMPTIEEYSKLVFDRLAQLGVKLVVFGAGRSKSVPEGFSREKAWDQLFEIGALFADLSKQYGQTIAVEPLSYNETNIINTVEDAIFYTDTVHRDNFKYMVDFYHFDNNGQSDASLLENSTGLVHAHFAAPKTRTAPQTEADWGFVRRCLQLLKAVNYSGGLSFEGKHEGCAQLTPMLEYLQKEVGISHA